jgi:uncharacterized protein (TIGR00288 family)
MRQTGAMTADEERIALFLDYENLAIGAREALGNVPFDFGPIADALAERGRVVVRRAYADWASFDDDRRALTRYQIELIEIPQRMGAVRKNAADIKMAVDAVELCLERDYITTFVLGTGDSDFTPLVHKLRELNRRVIGVGVEASTSAMLPPACDEFLFYERLEGVEPAPKRRRTTRRRRTTTAETSDEAAAPEPETHTARDVDLDKLVTGTLSGLERSGGGPVLASNLKRTLLRKDPTFDEATFGFRGWGELLGNLADRHVVEVQTGAAGDPEVSLPHDAGDETKAFALLRATVERLTTKTKRPHLSGLKTEIRREQSDFSEKRFGYRGFLQFAKAAQARGVIEMEWDADADDYVLRPGPVEPAAG